MKPWLQYPIAFIVVCHGFIYVRIGPVIADSVKEWRGRSWLLDGAAAIAFGPSVPGWWRPLAIASGVTGLAAFSVFWDGQTQRLFEEGAAGAAISLVLLMSAFAFPAAFD